MSTEPFGCVQFPTTYCRSTNDSISSMNKSRFFATRVHDKFTSPFKQSRLGIGGYKAAIMRTQINKIAKAKVGGTNAIYANFVSGIPSNNKSNAT